MPLPIVYHPDYMAPLKPGHRFPMSKYGYLRRALQTRGLLPETGGFLAPSPASDRMLARVHALDYVDRVLTQTRTAQETRAIGLPDTPAVARRAQLSAAGTTLAARLALEGGLGLNMAGGSHHAGPLGGAGFCVFNDVAVAAQALLDEGHVARVWILDLDVHQGDGTARIFATDPRVHCLSIHGANNYPEDKATSDMDVALPDGTEDRAYLAALEGLLGQLAPPWPDLVFYNAGVDPHGSDRLGRLSLTSAGLRARDHRVLTWCAQRAIPVTGVIGGGYSDAPEELAARHAILFEEAARVFGSSTGSVQGGRAP
ncbi:MAG: histone deacetylase [Pseudomonadota bacterium]